jgi:hypothetical protein
MAVLPENAANNGLPSLQKTAKALCRVVTAFAPIVRAQYPANTELMAALTLAETVCSALVPAVDAQIQMDAEAATVFDPLDGDEIIGRRP